MDIGIPSKAYGVWVFIVGFGVCVPTTTYCLRNSCTLRGWRPQREMRTEANYKNPFKSSQGKSSLGRFGCNFNMSEYSTGGGEDLSLPKATVQKIIGEILPKDIAISKDAREAITELSIEFIMILSTQLNDIAEKEAKRTIASDHVIKALEELGFHNYLEIINKVLDEHKELLKGKEKKNNKFQNSGLSEEELLKQQEELFKKSRARLQNNSTSEEGDVKQEIKLEI